MASAAAPESLFKFPEDVTPGAGAGQLNAPLAVAGNPTTGRLYISDHNNARISEFTAWGSFVKAWGWDVSPDGSPGDTPSDELEICTAACKTGTKGNGPGQFAEPQGVTLDAAGNLYVFDQGGQRILKFSPAGEFLLSFGGEGTEDGQLENSTFRDYLAYDPVANTIVVGDKGRIQEFDTDGDFVSKIDFVGELEAFTGKTVKTLETDNAGNLYFAFEGVADVYKLSASRNLTPLVFPVENAVALTLDTAGNLYAVEAIPRDPLLPIFGHNVLGFDAEGVPITGMEAADEFAKPEFSGPSKITAQDIVGLGTNLCPGSEEPGNLYVIRFRLELRSYLSVYGSPPIGCEPPPAAPPEIEEQYAVSVDTDGALLRAEISPRFWTDTTYYIQYGTAPCSLGGCETHPAPPGAKLTAKSTNAAVTTAGVFLADLEPDTTYHYRFVAQSGGSGGEPVIGVGGKPGEDGAEGTFTTFPATPSLPDPDPCPNAALRQGSAARLPDCRAYELVSPLDKNNGDIIAPAFGDSTDLVQAAHSGGRLTFASATSFADPESAPFVSQYLVTRESGVGWRSESISPLRTRPVPEENGFLENEFLAFSADLCSAWLRTYFDPPLDEDAVAGRVNLYRRDNCDGGGYEGLTPVEPPNAPLGDNRLGLQGVSADGSHAIYLANDSLTEDAPGQPPNCSTEGACEPRLYEYVRGEGLRFVCILPNGNPSALPCYAGTLDGGVEESRRASFHNAISADGERIFWTASATKQGEGKIYLRIGGEETLDVSKAAEALSGTSRSRFWSAAPDGSSAIITTGGLGEGADLYRFELGEEAKTTPIAVGVRGLLGVSEDASRVYFASTEALTGGEKNSEGDIAQAGRPNLYLWEAPNEATTFVATLAGEDTSGLLTPITFNPFRRSSRVSPDGRHAAFMSRGSLTGYDNLDVASGEPAAEVFLYDAEEQDLLCVSCNRSDVRPSGRELREVGNPDVLWAAARISPWTRAFHASRSLAEDGSRLFFESFEALTPRDTNGMADVYQWEEPGSGDCDSADVSFDEEAGGCVELISSGQNPGDSLFLDASASGSDVFISTLSSLVAQDPGLVDVYDARVQGGFPPPSPPPAACEGEACQGPQAPPDDPTPASAAFEGAGNLVEARKPPRCRKGKVRRTGRCVAKKKRRAAKRTASRKGRTGR